MISFTDIKLCLVLWLLFSVPVHAEENLSTCYGTTANGSLKNGVVLPKEGKNFEPFAGWHHGCRSVRLSWH